MSGGGGGGYGVGHTPPFFGNLNYLNLNYHSFVTEFRPCVPLWKIHGSGHVMLPMVDL